MTKVIDKAYIYECDLKQFFPSVNVSKLTSLLEATLKLPIGMSNGITTLNCRLPVLPKEILLEEKYTINDGPKEMRLILEEEYDFKKSQLDWFNIAPDGGVRVLQTPIGVPQGAPTSPLLAILILVKSFLVQEQSISYADDPIFYSNSDFEIKDEPIMGIRLHEGKSAWVKREGK